MRFYYLIFIAFVFCSLSCFDCTAQTKQSRETTAAAPPDDSQAVIVKDDRFGGGRTITLKPQTLIDTSDHLLTLELELKLKTEGLSGIDELDREVTLSFRSLSRRGQNFGDKELRFLLDGKPFGAGPTSNRVYRGGDPERPELRVGEQLIGIMSLSALQKVVSARSVEMQLGGMEIPVSAKTLSALRSFVRSSATGK
jgi:hypothetical protein